MRGGSRTDEDRRCDRPRVVHVAGGAIRLLPGSGAPAQRRGSGGGDRRGSHRMGRVPLPRATTARGCSLLRRVLLQTDARRQGPLRRRGALGRTVQPHAALRGGAAVNALSGVDIALWDAVGRSLSLPVHKLLGGGFRSEVTPYATGFYRRQEEDPTEAGIREAKRHVSEGFRAVKLKVGFGVDVDIEYVGAIREAVGPGVRIMMDANCAYDAPATRRILLGCRDAGVHFFEEPLAPEDLEGYKALRHLTDTHLAAGENLFEKTRFRRWISEGALDILQPDLCSSGGFTECKKIAAIAQAWNTAVVPHVWGTGIGLAAALQFMATLPPTRLSMNPEEPMLEYDTSSHPFHQDLIGGAVRMSDGKVRVPQNPGIGVEVDRDTLERYGRQIS